MTRAEFILKLEEVSANIESVPLSEVAILLRRAAIRLRNLPPPEVNERVEREFQQLMSDMNAPD